MIKHALSNIDALNLEIGVPAILMISGGENESKITIEAPPTDMKQIDFKIKDEGGDCHILLRDRCQGKNNHMNCTIMVHLRELHLEKLFIKTACGKIKIKTMTLHQMNINNVNGGLKISRDVDTEVAHLTLVSCDADIFLGKSLQTSKIKTIQCSTRINADGFDGMYDINVTGAKARVDDITMQNGRICTERKGKDRKISCEVISGKFSINSNTHNFKNLSV